MGLIEKFKRLKFDELTQTSAYKNFYSSSKYSNLLGKDKEDSYADSIQDFMSHVKNIEITKDNIADYYEFMSDEDKITHKDALYGIHANRYKSIRQTMIKDGLIFETNKGIDNDALHFNRDARKFNQNAVTYYYDISYFGIKDILKPIDEYIKDIKASEQYKESKLKNIFTNLDLSEVKRQFEQIKEVEREHIPEYNVLITYSKEFDSYGFCFQSKNNKNNNNAGDNITDVYTDGKYVVAVIDVDTLELVDSLSEEVAGFDIKSNLTENATPTPTIDECLQQIEIEEAAKQKAKSPHL